MLTYWNDFLSLFFPKDCINCNGILLQREKFLCTTCFHDLPIIEIESYHKNDISKLFVGKVPIKNSVSLLYYRKYGITKKLIHELKYKGNEDLGVFLGNLLGDTIKNNTNFRNIDYIISVPLHPKKEKQRGYNQLAKFGETLGTIFKVTYLPKVLQCTLLKSTQTSKDRFDRFSNAETKFSLIQEYKNLLEDKHVLLIDDVVTTGATLEACCKELLKVNNITISIATMAYTEKI